MALKVESVLSSFGNSSSKIPFWNIDLPKSPWDVDDDLEDLDVLCELVRNQYLKRLHQTLLNNLDVTSSYKKKPLYQIQHCVDICMAELEKQALRRCMIASIYREGMTNLINKVKTCTKNSMLYDLLKHIIESNNQLPSCDKLFEAENITEKSVGIDVSVNTEQKCNKITSTQTEIWTDPDNNLPNNFPVNKMNTDLVNKCNLPSSSYNVKSKISESNNIFNNLNSLLKSSCSSNSSPDVHMEVNYKYDSSEFENIQRKGEQENSTPNDIVSINALLRDLQDSPEYEQQSSTLEERLIALGLAIENNKSTDNLTELTNPINISPSIIRPNKINEILTDKFKSKRVAKSYQLRNSMNELPQSLQIRLNQKFKDLFGNSHYYESDPLSEEEERIIAHKRIVKMVVEFMTPYYKAHRINRHLFKNLAKLISKNLMDRSYDPDENTVAKGVSEFFAGNRCIKTVEDIYINY
ncbi:uncharacterized protein LOC100169414 [Acyrthosiphon pisum]|uniref:Set2 Rpb1 interacting domain-containing protein n=1 Tax=Acyrthosiphon pisum TaxID=7029 RepID=A0A8R2ADJ8_ACYPI|nr:uncharacterized protein LOC100169414 [Acyrthosiphon pisum]|eukprot:XP_001949885.1 PREDICTED: uncharacterized protein LOC100169414 [Acyrthosiphon pisum]